MSSKSYDQRLKERWKKREHKNHIKKVGVIYPSYGRVMTIMPFIMYPMFSFWSKRDKGR